MTRGTGAASSAAACNRGPSLILLYSHGRARYESLLRTTLSLKLDAMAIPMLPAWCMPRTSKASSVAITLVRSNCVPNKTQQRNFARWRPVNIRQVAKTNFRNMIQWAWGHSAATSSQQQCSNFFTATCLSACRGPQHWLPF